MWSWHQVEPCDVDADIHRVVSQRGLNDGRHVGAGLGVVGGLPGDLPEPGNVVDKCEEAERNDVTSGPTESANGSGLEGQTYGYITFDTDAEGQVNTSC